MAKKALAAIAVLALIAILALVVATTVLNMEASQKPSTQDTVPHEGKYGIYVLNLATEKAKLLYSTDNEIYTSALRLNAQGEKLVFAQNKA